MKCVFSLSGDNEEYIEMAQVLVLSAKRNTRLDLYCVYDGENSSVVEWMDQNGVSIIRWEISFLQDLTCRYDGTKTLEFCRGTYLCMEIPYILKRHGIIDKYILYVDVDSMFVAELDPCEYKPSYFSAPNDWDINDSSRFSTGVMIMNCYSLLSVYPAFLSHLKSHNYNFEFAGMGPCDQGAWNTFFEGKNDRLPPTYDWKPWWGKSDSVRIVHFSGPKPRHIKRLINEVNPRTEIDRIHKFVVDQAPSSYLFYVDIWEGIAMQK